ncbi:MAG: hypothetical protein PHY47_00330 [Lachnospiraceae bacterium]|nr:hypothetical protein [Lachnospiraceae bacterium]
MGPYSINREDLTWSDMGDFTVALGDIEDTRAVKGKGFIEECQRRIQSSFNDWKLRNQDGANLHVFKDRINNEILWNEIKDSIVFALTFDSFLSPLDLTVHVAPVSATEVAVRIDFSDNIKKHIDPSLHMIKVIYNLTGEGPFIMR